MREYLATLVRSAASPLEARNTVREYLQALILQSLQRSGAMTVIAFHGGTALRFLFSLPRYSEDLDFALEHAGDSYDFQSWMGSIRKDLERQGYDVTLKVNDRKTVHAAFVRFTGLLFDLDLTHHRDEVLSVKVEVDTHPPPGAVSTTSLVRRHVLLNLHHHDRASLLAGKLHAVLQRSFLKGRDVYDLIWYLSDREWPAPNLVLLNHALEQTNWTGPSVTQENWRAIVRDRIESSSWTRVQEDALPFLASQEESAFLTKENLLRLLT